MAAPSFAQQRDTGRHKPEPTPKQTETPAEPEAVGEPGARRWRIAVAGGLQSGGDLFRVETRDGLSQTWQGIGGTTFNSPRYTATFDQDLSLAVQISRDMGERWSLRGELGYARMDVAAEALTGQIGVLYQYDRFSLFNVALGAEFRLTGAESYPFCSLAALVSKLSPSTFGELGQTNVGGRLGLGYHQIVNSQVALRFEARVAATPISVDDYSPPTSPASEPDIDFEAQSSAQYFEVLVGVQTAFGQ
jgi:hypothetical protein